jgi:hypothetical protein
VTHDRRADVLRAFDLLKPGPDDHELRDAIARLLGMEWTPARTKPGPEPPSIVPPPQPPPGAPPVAPRDRARRAAQPDAPIERPPDAVPEPLHVEQSKGPERRPPKWLEHAAPLARVDLVAAKPPPVPPLLDPLQSRAVLSGTLSRRFYDGPLDVERVVERICRGEAVIEIPRLMQPTMARGVQVLIDRGEGMVPYAADVQAMRDELGRVVGNYALEILQFAHSPLRGAGKKSRRTWRPYAELTPPRRGATIIALTDLGIRRLPPPANPASEDEWIQLASYLDRFECPLVALVPYGPDRWPVRLRKRFAIIEWDRRTTVGRVRATIAHGLP